MTLTTSATPASAAAAQSPPPALHPGIALHPKSSASILQAHLSHAFLHGICPDVRVRVFGREYKLHKLILAQAVSKAETSHTRASSSPPPPPGRTTLLTTRPVPLLRRPGFSTYRFRLRHPIRASLTRSSEVAFLRTSRPVPRRRGRLGRRSWSASLSSRAPEEGRTSRTEEECSC